MRITIGDFRGVDRTVPVTFKDGTFEHSRNINAVLTETGGYDKAGTKARAAEVALGVAAKRERGLFIAPEPPADA